MFETIKLFAAVCYKNDTFLLFCYKNTKINAREAIFCGRYAANKALAAPFAERRARIFMHNLFFTQNFYNKKLPAF